MYITVYVTESAARALRQALPSSETRELTQIVEGLGARLEPLASSAEEVEASRAYAVEAPDAQTAEELVRRLQDVAAVESVYWKPADELPAGLP